jgi:hypothetical protein
MSKERCNYFEKFIPAFILPLMQGATIRETTLEQPHSGNDLSRSPAETGNIR